MSGHKLNARQKLLRGLIKCQGTTSTQDEKLLRSRIKCQGTTLVVPKEPQNEWALAPAEHCFLFVDCLVESQGVLSIAFPRWSGDSWDTTHSTPKSF